MLIAMGVVDNTKFRSATEHAVIVIDTAIPDPRKLAEHLGQLLGAEIIHMNITNVNLLQETTTVDVTYRRTSQ
jgi:tRNA A-37 threonylcarbamoyl transferase component Bud32